ncbi:MAG: hypothetical protein OXM55_02350 [Bdellovibrionales bacterium]|nr:hypothetical protein [Bdellovibrionales bacterium]
MNIFVLYFFIAILAFHTSSFSHKKKVKKLLMQEQTDALLDLCLSEITTRRIALREEMKELSTEMQAGDDTSTNLSEHDNHIYLTLMKALILNTITEKPLIINLSETTCDIFLDNIISDPETKSTAVDMFFSHFEKHTDAFIRLEFMKFLSKEKKPVEEIPEEEFAPYIKKLIPTRHTPLRPTKEDLPPSGLYQNLIRYKKVKIIK